MKLTEFIRESNRIEGIVREPSRAEVAAHEAFLELPEVRVAEVAQFVYEIAGASLRSRVGMDVRVGPHRPPPGGPEIKEELGEILLTANEPGCTPWWLHTEYERLHPFMDGNGRSGRVLWAWMRFREGRDPLALGFLHAAYYEALEGARQ